MIGNNEMTRIREERIAKSKAELAEFMVKCDSLEIQFNSLKITAQKAEEQKSQATKDLADTVLKLHLTNKSRHETEIKLGEELERTRSLQEAGKLKA